MVVLLPKKKVDGLAAVGEEPVADDAQKRWLETSAR